MKNREELLQLMGLFFFAMRQSWLWRIANHILIFSGSIENIDWPWQRISMVQLKKKNKQK